ncbi:MAG TPA: amidohydrolase [Thermoplasmatales archaeon]|nr:amidohydrolase [Thermoplasmatales archaeon]
MIEKVVEGRAYINGTFTECCIGIDEGRIVSIKRELKGEERYRFPRSVIIPAAIDMHVHFREPGFPKKEDFFTGTLSAAFGGISCVIDMPNTNPPTLNISSLLDKIALASRKACIDFGLYGCISNDNINDIERMNKMVTAFKVFLGESTNSLVMDMDKIDLLTKLNLSKVIAFHAEDEMCLEKYRFKAGNIKEYASSRPSICERKAIERLLETFSMDKKNIHICHITSSASLDIMQSKPNNFTVGVTPHHLLFNVDMEIKPDTYLKVNPPIRGKLDQESLWDGLRIGYIDVIESDHAPHTIDEKEKEFWEAPSGIPGTETMLPLMLYQFTMRDIPLAKLINMVCEKPADMLGVPKGKIDVGRDADLVVINLRNVERIKAEKLHSRCGYTPYEGFKAVFPTHLFVRGEMIIDSKEFVGDMGYGEYISRGENLHE